MHHNPSYPHTTGQEGEAATKLLIVVSFFLLLCVTRRDPDLAGRSFGTRLQNHGVLPPLPLRALCVRLCRTVSHRLFEVPLWLQRL